MLNVIWSYHKINPSTEDLIKSCGPDHWEGSKMKLNHFKSGGLDQKWSKCWSVFQKVVELENAKCPNFVANSLVLGIQYIPQIGMFALYFHSDYSRN